MSGEEILLQSDVASVAEMAVEPSYISEIARKLRQADPEWSTLDQLTAVNMVGRAVKALDRDGRLTVEQPEYGTFGGQRESSRKFSLAGAGSEETDEWKTYTIVRSKTPFDNVRSNYQPYVDTSITMSEKKEIIDNVSRMGNVMSRQVENILYDQAVAVFDDAISIEETDYNDPGVDLLVEFDEKVVAYEISTRWDNPIDRPYSNSKVNSALDSESLYGKPVDLVIMAPRFTTTVEDRYGDGDIVSIQRLPRTGDGFPIITSDDSGTIDRIMVSDLAGPGYPIVIDDNSVFIDDVETLLRSANPIRESQYRGQLTTILESERPQ